MLLKCSYVYFKKNEKKDKKKKYNFKKKMKKKVQLQKNITKKIQLKNTATKMSGQRKEWVKGEEEPIEINCLVLLPESFSFPFMKLYRNVFQIKTYCHIQLWLIFLYLFRVMAL